MRDEALKSLREFNEVVERLRAPGGCPWDREQTHKTLGPYMLEETYEVLDAIQSGSEESLREELGDLLLQVLMHSAIAAESRGDAPTDSGFDLGDVADIAKTKMIHRHPHVFGDTAVGGAAGVVVNWEKLKAKEKPHRESVLDGVPKSLPALAYAQATQKRPARVGFSEPVDVTTALAAARAALAEIELRFATTLPSPRGQDWVVSEGEIASADTTSVQQAAQPTAELGAAMGEVLWNVAGLARLLRINAEEALRTRANDFGQQVREIEKDLRDRGLDVHSLTDSERSAAWGSDGARP